MKRAIAEGVVVTLALVLFGALCTGSLRVKSLTMDETVYIPGGSLLVEKGEFGFNPEQPPLPKLLAGLANLGVNKTFPEPFELSAFLKQNQNNLQEMTRRARTTVVLLGMLLCLIVYRFSRELFGPAGGLFSLACCCLSPNLAAHSRLVTGDLPLACFATGLLYFLHRLSRRFRWRDLAAAAVMFSLALGSKFTALLFPLIVLAAGWIAALLPIPDPEIPPGPIMGRLARLSGVRLRTTYVAVLVIVLVMLSLPATWALYGFETGRADERMEPEVAAWLENRLAPSDGEEASRLSKAIRKAVSVPIPAPSLAAGLIKTLSRGEGEWTYLAGKISFTGWWYYFPAVIALKTPLAFLAAWLLCLILLFRGSPRPSQGEIYCLGAAVLLVAFFSAGDVQLGLRYILPAYPMMFVLSGRLLAKGDFPRAPWKPIAAGLALVWALIANLAVFPHYLTYFNEAAGGPKKGHLWLADSNLDWGQDLIGLSEYMRETGIERVKFSYFGNVSPEIYGIQFDYLAAPFYVRDADRGRFPSCRPVGGDVVVSATNLVGVFMEPTDCYRWARAISPEEVVGNTLFVYRLPEPNPSK